MKHLRIEYTTESGSKIILFDDDVNEVAWNDTPNGVRVEGRTGIAPSGNSLLELIANASKARAEEEAEETPASTSKKKAAPRKKAPASGDLKAV